MSKRPLDLNIARPACLGEESLSVRWVHADDGRDRREGLRWCAAAGPPVIMTVSPTDESPAGPVTILSWNTHVGGGDVRALVGDLRAGRLTGRPAASFVLLLQEVYRRSPQVPRRVPAGARTAGFMRHGPRDAVDRDIETTARSLGLNLFYAPSMRNGGAEAQEDRGNAILSTIPLEDCTVIELPLERQRRVVVAATIRGRAANGLSTPIRIASVHLTNMVAHHGWLFSEPGRTRQARALARSIDGGSIVLGGDFNTWFDSWDGAFREIARRIPPPPERDGRPTFFWLRLDHFFCRLPAGWRFGFRRADNRYGSDHYPLVGELRPAL